MPEVITLLENIPEARLVDLLTSLRSGEVTSVKPRCKYSRSGMTLFCSGFVATFRTNKHEHELDCHTVETMNGMFMTCSWKVDGKEIAVIQFRPDEDVIRVVRDIISAAVRIERIGNVQIPQVDSEEIVLRPRPTVVWSPKVSVYP